jgi:predicted RNA binding protein YcfA (HicA-like mRNA interferase family)
MIDTTANGIDSDAVVRALATRGFRCEHRARHTLALRDATRVVVPGPGRRLPPTYVRRIEHALTPLLGEGWLTRDPERLAEEPSGSEPAHIDEVLVLDAFVDRCEVSGDWCAFLADEFAVMGTDPTRDGALRDLKAATAVWLGVEPACIALVTPDVV